MLLIRAPDNYTFIRGRAELAPTECCRKSVWQDGTSWTPSPTSRIGKLFRQVRTPKGRPLALPFLSYPHLPTFASSSPSFDGWLWNKNGIVFDFSTHRKQTVPSVQSERACERQRNSGSKGLRPFAGSGTESQRVKGRALAESRDRVSGGSRAEPLQSPEAEPLV